MHGLLLPFLNFSILAGLLFYYLRQPVRNFVSQRHTNVRDELNRVHRMLQEAQEKYEEFSSKLKAMDAEAAALREQSRQDAEAMKNRVLQEAQRLASLIVADARQSADTVFSDLRKRVYSEFGTQIVERAETLIVDRLTQEDRTRIRQEFSSQVQRQQHVEIVQ